MKKKLLLAFIPAFLLTSCAGVKEGFLPYLDEQNGLPTIHLDAGDHVTYLLLSPFGSIENYQGISAKGKVTELFYENTVVLTANAVSGTKEKYLEAGFDDYLSKPIDREELDRVLKELFIKNHD